MLATNESVCALLFTIAAYASVLLVERGTLRAAVLAGVAVGAAAGSKYTGAVACVTVAVAAISVPNAPTAHRLRLLAAAAGASIATFLLVCPWVVLDLATFSAHFQDLTRQVDRIQDGRSFVRYAEAAWTTLLGPVWSVAAVMGIVFVGVGRFAGWLPGEGGTRGSRLAVLAGALALFGVLVGNAQMACGRYLLPAVPSLVAVAAAVFAGLPGGSGKRFRLALAFGTVLWAAQECVFVHVQRFHPPADATAPVRAWIVANIPDGGHVVVDWHAPRLPPYAARRQFEGKVSARVLAEFTPAWRVTTAYDYFVRPVRTLDGTDIPVDDLDRLATEGPVWFVLSDAAERTLALLPESSPPAALRFLRLVRERVPVVQEFGPEGLVSSRGTVRIHRLDRRE